MKPTPSNTSSAAPSPAKPMGQEATEADGPTCCAAELNGMERCTTGHIARGVACINCRP